MKRNGVFSATYRDGAFHPDEPCDLPEGTRVMVGETLNGVSPALESDPVERRRIIKALLADMKKNPLNLASHGLSRDELHERRPFA